MAKHRHRERNASRSSFDIKNQSRRDDFTITNDLRDSVFEPVSRSLPRLEAILENPYTAVRSTLQDVEDRRTFHPAGRSRPATSSRRHLVKIKPTKLTAFAQTAIHTFAHPKFVMTCIRRKMRKEILHALGKSGKGSRYNKKPKYNQHSKVRC